MLPRAGTLSVAVLDQHKVSKSNDLGELDAIPVTLPDTSAVTNKVAQVHQAERALAQSTDSFSPRQNPGILSENKASEKYQADKILSQVENRVKGLHQSPESAAKSHSSYRPLSLFGDSYGTSKSD